MQKCINKFFSQSKTYCIRTMLWKFTFSKPFTPKELYFIVPVFDDDCDCVIYDAPVIV